MKKLQKKAQQNATRLQETVVEKVVQPSLQLIHEGLNSLGVNSPSAIQKRQDALELLHHQGLINEACYKDLTEKLTAERKNSPQSPPQPDFFAGLSNTPTIKVTRKRYDWESKSWQSEGIMVHIALQPFAKGAMRMAFAMIDLSRPANDQKCVAKRQLDSTVGRDVFETDVIMQSACQSIARGFNAKKPIKLVHFLDAYLIETSDGVLYAVEPYLEGEYVKYNNNYGYVSGDRRFTPQAFTHFSYEFSEHKLMIVDVQGVGDAYTDPQIHSTDGRGFGNGNLGEEGMNRFLKTHWCNPICVSMGLPFCRPKLLGIIKRRQRVQTGGTAAPPKSPDLRSNAGEAFHAIDYVSDLKPQHDSATDEDLALLGIRMAQFNKLVDAFNAVDADKDGVISANEVGVVLADMNLHLSQAEWDGLVKRLQRALQMKNQQLEFIDFVCCVTGNE